MRVVVWIVASLGFAYYVKTFANYNAMYGSIVAIMILLLYLYISSAWLLPRAGRPASVRFSRQS